MCDLFEPRFIAKSFGTQICNKKIRSALGGWGGGGGGGGGGGWGWGGGSIIYKFRFTGNNVCNKNSSE